MTVSLETSEETQPLITGRPSEPRICACKCRRKQKQKEKRVAKYYEQQAELTELYRIDDERMDGRLGKSDDVDKASVDRSLSKIVLFVNVILLIGKITATILTLGSSLAIISTLMDSIVDITSGLAVWYASNAVLHTDRHVYPRGRSNLEGISIIFIGIVMGMANFFVFFESVRAIIETRDPPILDLISMAILLGTIFIKAILFVMCRRAGTQSCRVLATDQINDVLTNIFAIGGAVGAQWWRYADPMAASLISGYITISWSYIIFLQMPELSGVKCTREEYSRILRVAIQHSERIKYVDTLLAYHTGPQLRVEVHVVVDPETTTRIVHDEVVASLEHKLGKLDFIERAFVHADYELDGYEP